MTPMLRRGHPDPESDSGEGSPECLEFDGILRFHLRMMFA